MKRTWALGVVGAVAAASLGIAAPASAQCGGLPPLPESQTVSHENGQIRINPSGVGGDAGNIGAIVTAAANDAVDCAWGAVPDPVLCALRFVLLAPLVSGYVYEDPWTGEIVIDYGRALADANACI